MFRGTTPTIYFKIKNVEDISTITEIWITFRYKEKIFLNKKLSEGEVDVDIENNTVSINLTQEETLSFHTPEMRVQMKVKFVDDNVVVSPIFTLKVDTPLNTDIMKDPYEDFDNIDPNKPPVIDDEDSEEEEGEEEDVPELLPPASDE